jgi:hypothetical protein
MENACLGNAMQHFMLRKFVFAKKVSIEPSYYDLKCVILHSQKVDTKKHIVYGRNKKD